MSDQVEISTRTRMRISVRVVFAEPLIMEDTQGNRAAVRAVKTSIELPKEATSIPDRTYITSEAVKFRKDGSIGGREAYVYSGDLPADVTDRVLSQLRLALKQEQAALRAIYGGAS